MKNFKWLLSVLAIVLAQSCSSGHEEDPAGQKFRIISPLVKDTVYVNEYIGSVQAFQNVGIRSRVSGFIEKVLVDEGQPVREGQMLFTIDNKQFLQDLQKAQAATQSVFAELRVSEIELEGSKKLLDKDFISQSEYNLAMARTDMLQAKLKEARAQEAQVRLSLAFTGVKAPFEGVINRIPYKAGSLVEESTVLTTISNIKEMLVYFNVSESDYLEYLISDTEKSSKEVTLVLANGVPYAHKGIVETMDSEFDSHTGTLAFRARFPNPDKILKHGATGKIQINTLLKDALLIPQKSTFDRQEELFVFVLESDHTLRARKIEPMLRLPHLFVVGSGLSPQDKILYEGVQLVKEGDKVRPEIVSFSEIFN